MNKKSIKNNKGLSLIETLVVTSILGVSAFGLLKATQKTLLTSEIVNLHEDTEELKNSVYTFLNNKEYCINNLLTETNLSNQDGDGVQNITQLRGTSNVLFRVRTDNPTQKPIKDTKGGIQIIDMKLKDKKTFYLYYKYTSQALGDRQKRTDDDCTTDTNGTNKHVKGCYYLSCEIDSSCADPNNCGDDPDDICKPLDCGVSETNNANTVTCDLNQILVSNTNNKQNDCIQGCPANNFLVGIKTNTDGTKEVECAKIEQCDTGKVAIGIEPKNPGGTEYKTKCEDWICPAGQHRVLRVENGQTVSKCENICHGGQRIISGYCDCPTGPHTGFTEVENGNCICQNHKVVDSTTGKCVCPDDSNPIGGGCVCKSGNSRNSEGKCLCSPLTCPDEHCICEHGTGSKGECLQSNGVGLPEGIPIDNCQP